MRKFIAIILFLNAAWLVFTFVGAPTRGQAIGQIMWVLILIVGGLYLMKRAKNK